MSSITTPALKASRMRIGADRVIFNVIGYAALTIFALLCIIPFYIILVASFTSEMSIMRDGYSFYIKDFSLEGYELILKNPTIISRAYLNTIVLTLTGTVIAVFLVTMCGYVLQRKDFPWRRPLMLVFYFRCFLTAASRHIISCARAISDSRTSISRCCCRWYFLCGI